MELAPSPMDLVPITGLQQALPFLDENGRNEERNAIEDRGSPHVRAPLQEDNDNFVSNLQSTGSSQDLRESISSAEADESEDLQSGAGNNSGNGKGSEETEYVIERLVDHTYQGGELVPKEAGNVDTTPT